MKGRAAALGRNPDEIVITPGLGAIIEDTDEAAQARVGAHREKLDFDKLLVQLGRAFNYHDFKQYDLDAPFPDVSHLSLNSYKGFAERIVRRARDENLTLRETALRQAQRRRDFVGSPTTVADDIQRWFEGRACDGFVVGVSRPSDFRKFRELVVPILQDRGIFKTEYQHDTLRGHLGLPVPENRWVAGRTLQAAE